MKDRSKIVSQKRLKECLHYNPKDGLWFWLQGSKRVGIGDVAGSFDTKGYRQIEIDGQSYRASRLAWLYMEGYYPEYEIDHIDRDKTNDSWNNLRHITSQCNKRNRGISSRNSSGVVGVSWNERDKKWVVRITVDYNTINLGETNDFNEAVRWRWAAEKEFNWKNCNTTSTAYLYLKNNNLI